MIHRPQHNLPPLHAAALANRMQRVPANAADIGNLNEQCRCCQGGVLDLDEAVGLVNLGGEQPGVGHQHAFSPLKAGVMTWLAVPGLAFGAWNGAGAWDSQNTIADTLAQIRQARGVPAAQAFVPTSSARAASPDVQLQQRDSNLRAYERTLQNSLSMQRFITWFAGLLPAVNAGVMLGSLLCPPLEIAGAALLAAYCGAHLLRYTTFERARLSALPALQRQGLSPMASEGQRHVEQVRTDRISMYGRVSAGFAAYGVGALLSSAVTLSAAPSMALIAGSGLSLVVGLVAVTYYNNFPVREAFGKNRNKGIDREYLGDDENVYRQVARRLRDKEALLEVRAMLQDRLAQARQPWALLGKKAGFEISRVLSFGLTFGLTMGWVKMQQQEVQRLQRHLLLDGDLLPTLTAFRDALRSHDDDVAVDGGEVFGYRPLLEQPHHHAHGAQHDHEHHKHDPDAHEPGSGGVLDHPQLAALKAVCQEVLQRTGGDCDHDAQNGHDHIHEGVVLDALRRVMVEWQESLDYEVGALVDHAHARQALQLEDARA